MLKVRDINTNEFQIENPLNAYVNNNKNTKIYIEGEKGAPAFADIIVESRNENDTPVKLKSRVVLSPLANDREANQKMVAAIRKEADNLITKSENRYPDTTPSPSKCLSPQTKDVANMNDELLRAALESKLENSRDAQLRDKCKTMLDHLASGRSIVSSNIHVGGYGSERFNIPADVQPHVTVFDGESRKSVHVGFVQKDKAWSVVTISTADEAIERIKKEKAKAQTNFRA